jgi:sirohydrochlorin ferrochelatase
MLEKDKAIIILVHGSRNEQVKEEFLKLVDLIRKRLTTLRIEPAIFQFSPEYSLSRILENLSDEGYKDVRIVPLFLFKGIHIKDDLPNIISREKSKYPYLNISISRTLWPDRRILNIIAERIKEAF